MSEATDHKDDDIALAGEYALHLMDAADRDAFERRLEDEPALRTLLREWDEGLIPLAEDIAPVAPPRHLKNQISLLLFQTATEPDAEQRRRRWPVGSFFGVLSAAALAMLLVVALPEIQLAPPGPAYTAQLASEDQSLIVTASFDPTRNALELDRLTGSALPGRALELWLIAEGADAPVSLGVLPDDQTATVAIPDALVAALAGGTLAISDEPPGGSPTGQPTGAGLAVGVVTAL